MNKNQLSKHVADQVLIHLKLTTTIKSNKEGLEQVFNAWCQHIPFDNFWKRLGLMGQPFQDKNQMNPNHFFEIWMEHGLGGTCWVSTTAMYSLLDYLNFNVRYIVGSMGNMGMINHGSLIVTFEDGSEFLVDTSVLNNQPIEISGEGISDKTHPIQLTKDEKNTLLIFEHVTKREIMPCAIMPESISFNDVSKHYQVSTEMSLFNDCVYIRKNDKNSVRSIIGTTYYLKSASTIESEELSNEKISATLINVMGVSKEIVAHIEKTNLYTLPKESMLLSLTKN